MVSYNKGRFIFLFDSGKRKLSAIYDTKYEKQYQVSHYSFITVFGVAIESLDNVALEELKDRLDNEPKYKLAISNILDSRKKQNK